MDDEPRRHRNKTGGFGVAIGGWKILIGIHFDWYSLCGDFDWSSIYCLVVGL